MEFKDNTIKESIMHSPVMPISFVQTYSIFGPPTIVREGKIFRVSFSNVYSVGNSTLFKAVCSEFLNDQWFNSKHFVQSKEILPNFFL